MKESFNLQESLTTKDDFAKNKHQENLKEGRRDDQEHKKAFAREKYIKPTCEIIEMEPIEMIAMSGEGSDTEDGGYEFGERDENGFESNRHRGEWGDLWK